MSPFVFVVPDRAYYDHSRVKYFWEALDFGLSLGSAITPLPPTGQKLAKLGKTYYTLKKKQKIDKFCLNLVIFSETWFNSQN